MSEEGEGAVIGGASSEPQSGAPDEVGEVVSSASSAEVEGEAAASLAPRVSNRIEGLDVARGFALLGIFLVNIEFMAYPLGILETRPTEDVVDLGVWAFVRIFCEGKFYPLFSMLFGMGLMLQRQRVVARGRPFLPLYLRRLVVLSGLGLVHGLLIWYGDVLFVYSFAGFVLMLCSGLSGRVLLGIGGAFWGLGIIVVGSLALLIPSDMPDSREELLRDAASIEVDGPPLEFLFSSLGAEGPDGPSFNGLEESPWVAAEIKAYREGSYFQAFGFRAMSFALLSVVVLMGGGLDILGMFFIGAGLVSLGLFREEGDGWPLRFVALALVIGIPVSAAGVVLPVYSPGGLGAGLGEIARILSGPMIALGYLGLWMLAGRSGLFRLARRALACTGRMALTNYLSQSVVATFVMYHWGLGQFGTWRLQDLAALVVGIYFVQLVVSSWWMERFRFGPLEWLWRSLTYGKLQPFSIKRT